MGRELEIESLNPRGGFYRLRDCGLAKYVYIVNDRDHSRIYFHLSKLARKYKNPKFLIDYGKERVDHIPCLIGGCDNPVRWVSDDLDIIPNPDGLCWSCV